LVSFEASEAFKTIMQTYAPWQAGADAVIVNSAK
jgi:hypothetical protein